MSLQMTEVNLRKNHNPMKKMRMISILIMMSASYVWAGIRDLTPADAAAHGQTTPPAP